MSDKIEVCANGHGPKYAGVRYFEGKHSVRCTGDKALCWWGPMRDTEEAAIIAWNEVMRAVRMQREAQQRAEDLQREMEQDRENEIDAELWGRQAR